MPMLKLLRKPAVCACLGRCSTSLFMDIQKGLFPKPVSIGPNARAWPEHEVQAVIKARIAGRSEADICALVKNLMAQRTTMCA